MFDVSHCPRHITGGLEQSISLLVVQPSYKTQEDNFDLVLQCWLNLLYLLLSLGLSYQVGGGEGEERLSTVLSTFSKTNISSFPQNFSPLSLR